jgi:ribosomal protein S3
MFILLLFFIYFFIVAINSSTKFSGMLSKLTSLLLKRNVRNLIRELQIKTNKNYYIAIQFIKNPFEDATLIAKYIADQLEKRIPFRRAVKQTIKKVQRTNMKGIKIQVSGRLNGVEMARSEWKRDGKVPLHTLRAKIDYTHQRAETIYGVIGIKVWLFSGEE